MTIAEQPPVAKRKRVEELLSKELGISIHSFVDSAVDALLTELPDNFESDPSTTLPSLLDACCIGETMFMRHKEHFETLPHVLSMPSSTPLKVWSAGCCTGEEVYSLAATLSGLTSKTQVLGTDVHPRFLRRARQGLYSTWSLRGVDFQACRHWLDIHKSGARVKPWLKRKAQFRRMNLLRCRELPIFDAIFCRNVLMYFYPDKAQHVFSELTQFARPGTVLFLGYFDPPPAPDSPWVPERFQDVLYYRLEDPGAGPNPAFHQQSLPAASSPEFDQAAALPEPKAAKNAPGAHPSQTSQHPMDDARRLASMGQAGRALRLTDELSQKDPLDPDPYALAALIYEELGSYTSAVIKARRAVFLRPESPYPRYLMGICLLGARDQKEARKHFLFAQRLLQNQDEDSELELGQGLVVRQLKALLRDQLQREDS